MLSFTDIFLAFSSRQVWTQAEEMFVGNINRNKTGFESLSVMFELLE